MYAIRSYYGADPRFALHAVTGRVGAASPEARSGLDPWSIADLPEPPRPRGWQWLAAVGPGVILLGASIGSGEFLLGPAVMVKYGLALLWIARITSYNVCYTKLLRFEG